MRTCGVACVAVECRATPLVTLGECVGMFGMVVKYGSMGIRECTRSFQCLIQVHTYLSRRVPRYFVSRRHPVKVGAKLGSRTVELRITDSHILSAFSKAHLSLSVGLPHGVRLILLFSRVQMDLKVRRDGMSLVEEREMEDER